MANIQPIKEGEEIIGYKAYVEMGRDPSTGKRKRTTKTLMKEDGYIRKDAEVWVAEQITKRENNEYIEKNSLKVKEFISNWLEKDKKPHIATTTYNSYKNRIEAYIIPNLGEIPVQKLNAYHLNNFFAELREDGKTQGEGGLSENTLKKIYVILNMALKKAVKYEIINHSPLEAVDPPKPEDIERPVMSVSEIRKMLKTAKKMQNDNDYGSIFIYTYILFGFLTGMRRSEVLSLEWEDIDFKERTVDVSKRLIVNQYGDSGEKVIIEEDTKTPAGKRKIRIPDQLVFALKKFKNIQNKIKIKYPDLYYKEHNFIFCREDGKFYHPKTINNKFNKLRDKAGLDKKYTVHTLRHTFATISVKNKIDLATLKDIMGHSTVSTTIDLYVHPDIEDQKENAEKMGNLVSNI